MKHLIVSLTIGACLLVSSAGVVFATDPHKPSPAAPGVPTGSTGQPGTGGVGMSCSGGTNVTVTPPPGQANNSSVNSPFNDSSKAYAGTGLVGNGQPNSSGHANSQYDVACFQMH
jgi:hypothetical protein